MTFDPSIGVPGKPWGEAERDQWRALQIAQRSYAEDVVSRMDALADRFERDTYGQIEYGSDTYDLHAFRGGEMDPALPTALITGGVHGYETSGVMGALAFLEQSAAAYAGRVNLLVAPCVSPWAYERINRWNYDAVDPNRNFRMDGPAREATALMEWVASAASDFLLHIDLHETTDSDETEFRLALSSRDGVDHDPGLIPDGFYLVADSEDPQLGFQQAIISAVGQVTHIAPPDEKGEIIGSPVIAHGIIEYPLAKLALCASITNARFKTTTEVYPDSPRVTPEDCVRAQVAAVCAALDFALEQ
ncbi:MULTISPECIES: M14 family metallopeptidase [Hyphomonas]|uniref:Peptidase n=1 Tax=Hyphomonas adhaerens TaxID=81029 RepID=A0A3B9H3Y4_9PROT|nr:MULTISPECIES: M14 family metallocarboxypeptidase [Hyphomonas]MBB38654.1 peptidase [Hyphomonas sp.]HAE29358.1 peptidase [Hyphomonas adhaerens]|tara:strand:- start:3174 stop:4085 length:912 start_codon:yes stop_codon:yes gene_type:complete